MSASPISTPTLLDAIERLRNQVERLESRLADLEAKLAGPTDSTAEISEEEILVLSAAVAAYLGVKPKIRQVRLVGGASWAQQGRATIQAARDLHSQRG